MTCFLGQILNPRMTCFFWDGGSMKLADYLYCLQIVPLVTLKSTRVALLLNLVDAI